MSKLSEIRTALKKSTTIPWFMATDSFLFITSNTVPHSFSRQRKVERSKDPVPGAGWSRNVFSSTPNETVEFSIKLVAINDDIGVTHLLKFFEMLTVPHKSAYGSGSSPLYDVEPFYPTPKVLYFYGLGKLPMWYDVDDVSITPANPNKLGFPREAEVKVSMTEDRDGDLYKIESGFSYAVANLVTYSSALQGLSNLYSSAERTTNPYVADLLSSLKQIMQRAAG
jgi:hypothetical protein